MVVVVVEDNELALTKSAARTGSGTLAGVGVYLIS